MDDSPEQAPADLVDSKRIESEERPTLKTIARISGFAVPTVSRALHDAPDIGEETKRRVRDIALSVGYRPNRAGVRLRTGKTNVISLVLSTEHDMMNHTARLVSSLASSLRATPYHLIITPYFPSEDPLDPIRYIVETGSADGIVMNQTEPQDRRVAYLLERDFPFVTHGRTDWQHAYADFDNRAFAEISVRRLHERGRRRIGLLGPPPGQSYAIHMRQGFLDAAAALGIEPTMISGVTSDSPSLEIEAKIRQYLGGPGRLDGLVVGSTTATMSVVSAAEDSGLTLGRDFDVAAKEAIPFLRRFRREILTQFENVNDVGLFLGRALMHRIANPGAPPMQWLDVPRMDVHVDAREDSGMGKADQLE